jgi:pimeloyl-ACP methyl ester carboxylesterase|tara:strand:- start:4295 stop:5041 length:747 start_codon:yes stop_codon:yes gene_type:complete
VGTGPHLCFLHGFCEDSRIWEPLVTEFAKTYTCITIDLPGFGASTNIPFTTIPAVAKQVKDLLDHENVMQPILLGHSLGGYIVAEYMHQCPDSLAAAAFIHSTTYADSSLKKENRLKSIDFINTHGTAEFFRIFIPGLVAPPYRARLRDDLTAMVRSTPISSVIAGLHAMRDREDHRSLLDTFDNPILLLRGEEDNHYQAHDIYEQAARCQAAQVSSLDNVGHLSMLEDQKKCLTEVKHFLDFVAAVS